MKILIALAIAGLTCVWGSRFLPQIGAVALLGAVCIGPVWIMRRVTKSKVHGAIYGVLITFVLLFCALMAFVSSLPRC